jgi:hypothetical protein
LRFEQWQRARDAGLALASCYAERQAAQRADAQQTEALARLGMRRGWAGEPGRGLTPFGLAFNEAYENDDEDFMTAAPFGPSLLPRRAASSVLFGSSSETSSSDYEEEEYPDDAIELQDDTGTALFPATRWVGDGSTNGSGASSDEEEEEELRRGRRRDRRACPHTSSSSYVAHPKPDPQYQQ